MYKKNIISWANKYDIHKQYIDASSQIEMQKTSLKSAINQRIAYEKDLESFVADFKKENQLRLEKNTIKTGSRKIPLIPLEAVIAVDKK